MPSSALTGVAGTPAAAQHEVSRALSSAKVANATINFDEWHRSRSRGAPRLTPIAGSGSPTRGICRPAIPPGGEGNDLFEEAVRTRDKTEMLALLRHCREVGQNGEHVNIEMDNAMPGA